MQQCFRATLVMCSVNSCLEVLNLCSQRDSQHRQDRQYTQSRAVVALHGCTRTYNNSQSAVTAAFHKALQARTALMDEYEDHVLALINTVDK